MTILTFPASITPQRTAFGLRPRTTGHESSLSGQRQTAELVGGAWAAALTINNQDADEWAELASFLVQLRGQAGRFYLFDHAHATPRGTPTGTPLVNGASQTGNTLVIDGADVSVTDWLKEADYFHFDTPSGRRELKQMTTAVNTDGSGNTTLTFEPPIREAPADNAAIVTASPSCIMMLEDDDAALWRNEPPAFSSFVVSCVEPMWVPL